MAKQWSMDEIDNLLETTQENGVSDLVAELMGEPAAAEQADPVDEATLPVLDEEMTSTTTMTTTTTTSTRTKVPTWRA